MPSRASDPAGIGWVHFASVFYIIAGIFNVIAGITALSKEGYFDKASMLWDNLQAWGWIMLVLGIVQVIVGFLIMQRAASGRVVGLALAVAGMVVWLLAWAAYPWWGLIMMLLYAAVIYALTVYREYFG